MSAADSGSPACFWEPAPQRPQLHCDEVHVWRAALARSPAEVETLKRLLSEDELRRAERFHFEHDRSSFVVARGTLREILIPYVGLPPELLRFGQNAYGKPELVGAPGVTLVRFNLSHAGGLALYAVAAGREVGVDIEIVRESVPCEELAERFFSRREVAALLALPAGDRTRAFFECWTRKEAYIKGRGEGLSLPLDSFDVSLAPGEPAALLATQEDERGAASWSLSVLRAHPVYAAAELDHPQVPLGQVVIGGHCGVAQEAPHLPLPSDQSPQQVARLPPRGVRDVRRRSRLLPLGDAPVIAGRQLLDPPRRHLCALALDLSLHLQQQLFERGGPRLRLFAQFLEVRELALAGCAPHRAWRHSE